MLTILFQGYRVVMLGRYKFIVLICVSLDISPSPSPLPHNMLTHCFQKSDSDPVWVGFCIGVFLILHNLAYLKPSVHVYNIGAY